MYNVIFFAYLRQRSSRPRPPSLFLAFTCLFPFWIYAFSVPFQIKIKPENINKFRNYYSFFFSMLATNVAPKGLHVFFLLSKLWGPRSTNAPRHRYAKRLCTYAALLAGGCCPSLSDTSPPTAANPSFQTKEIN